MRHYTCDVMVYSWIYGIFLNDRAESLEDKMGSQNSDLGSIGVDSSTSFGSIEGSGWQMVIVDPSSDYNQQGLIFHNYNQKE